MIGSWIADYFDNVMTEFIVNSRTDINLLLVPINFVPFLSHSEILVPVLFAVFFKYLCRVCLCNQYHRWLRNKSGTIVISFKYNNLNSQSLHKTKKNNY